MQGRAVVMCSSIIYSPVFGSMAEWAASAIKISVNMMHSAMRILIVDRKSVV